MTAVQPQTDSNPSPSPDYSQESGGGGRGLLVFIVVLLLISGGVYGAIKVAGPMGGADKKEMMTHTVEKSDLLVTVTEDGNVESASNVEIKCQVAGGSSILWIVPDGEFVKEGDKLVELDSAQLEEQINAQKITFQKALAAKTQAEKDFAVAKISVREYLEGVFKQNLQDAEAQITIAEENLRTAQNALEYSGRMFRKGYVSSLELEGQQFGVKRAQLELDSANTAKDVLVNFTKEKTLEDLNSQRDTAQARMNSENAAFELEEQRLKRLEAQLENCLIVAPQGGMVVYANQQASRGQQAATIEEGAAVRERQTILRLPDLEQMQVKVNVHETKVEQLDRDMGARVQIQDRDLRGFVVSIANQPEPTSWFSGSVKEYATIVKIDDAAENLKPGMTAEVEILVAELDDVLTIPIAAVVEKRGKYNCWVQKKNGEVERRPLVLGMSNDQFVAIKDGVTEGDKVVLSPRALIDEAREDGQDADEEVDMKSKFGTAPKSSGGPADGKGGPGSKGGPGAGRGGEGKGGPGGGRGGAKGKGGFNLAQYDKDGDGAISKDEAPEFMSTFFDRLDTNGDGKIDKAEQAAAAARSRNRQGGGGGGPGGGGPGGGRPGGQR